VPSIFAAIDHPKNKNFVDLLLEKRIAPQKFHVKILSLQHHVTSLPKGDTFAGHTHKIIPTMSAEQGQRERQERQTPASSTTATLMDLKHQQASLTERLDALWNVDTFNGHGRPHDEMIRRMVVHETLINSHDALLQALNARISMLETGGDDNSPEYAALQAEHNRLLVISCLEEANHESVFRDEVTHDFKLEAISEQSEQSGKITIATFECPEK